MADVTNQVLKIIVGKTTVDRALIRPEARLSDLDIASLDVVEIVFALEEQFGIEIPFNANSANLPFSTVGEVMAAVQRLVDAKAGPASPSTALASAPS